MAGTLTECRLGRTVHLQVVSVSRGSTVSSVGRVQ